MGGTVSNRRGTILGMKETMLNEKIIIFNDLKTENKMFKG